MAGLPKRLIDALHDGWPWLLAGSLLSLHLGVLLHAVSPTSSALARWNEALFAFLMATGSYLLLASLAAFLALTLLGGWLFRRFDPRLFAPLAPFVALPFAGPVAPNDILYVILPALVILAPLSLWATRSNIDAQRWFFYRLPLTLAAAALLGMVYLWLVTYPLRGPAGRHPSLALGVFGAACLAVFAPALLQLRTWPRRFGLLILAACFIAQNSGDENFPIYPSARVFGDSASRPNLILIVVDALRADMVSYRDAGAPPTPAIDQLAAESVVFANAISASSWTLPAMASIMTGVPPLKSVDPSSMLPFGDPNFRAFTPLDVAVRPTLAETLASRGYSTRAIVGNHLLFRPLNVAAGFQRIDTYADTPFGEGRRGDWWSRGRVEAMRGATTIRLTDEAIDWARNLSPGTTNFLWLHYFDPHDPYSPPARFEETPASVDSSETEQLLHMYQGEVRFIDSEISRLVAVLREEGLLENSILVLVSDHGEGFMEHGRLQHGYDLYQELVHVPLLIRMPGGSGHRVVPEFVAASALATTLLELLDIPEDPRPGSPPSLAAVVRGEEPAPQVPIVSGTNHLGEPQWSIIAGRMKYLYSEESGTESVFDLGADPGETQPLANPPADFLALARNALDEHMAFAEKTLQEAENNLDEDAQRKLLDRMRSLGYLQ